MIPNACAGRFRGSGPGGVPLESEGPTWTLADGSGGQGDQLSIDRCSVHDGIAPFVERHVLGQQLGAVAKRVASYRIDPETNGASSRPAHEILLASVVPSGRTLRALTRAGSALGVGQDIVREHVESAAHETDDTIGVPAGTSSFYGVGPGPDPFDQVGLGGGRAPAVRDPRPVPAARRHKDRTALRSARPCMSRCERSRRARTTLRERDNDAYAQRRAGGGQGGGV